MHYKIGVTCVYNVSNIPISQFKSLCNEFTSIWSMFVYNIKLSFVVIVIAFDSLFRWYNRVCSPFSYGIRVDSSR